MLAAGSYVVAVVPWVIPNILMQSTSVEVVSVNPAAAAELIGHAVVTASLFGAEYGSTGTVVPRFGTLDAAAPAVVGTKAVTALSVATASSNPRFLFALVSISPPYCGYIN
jgi:hypothetical protein